MPTSMPIAILGSRQVARGRLSLCQGAMQPSFSTPVKKKQVSLGWSFKRGIGDSEADGEGLVKGGMDSPDFVKESPFKTIRRTTSPASWKLFEHQLETARQEHVQAQQDILTITLPEDPTSLFWFWNVCERTCESRRWIRIHYCHKHKVFIARSANFLFSSFCLLTLFAAPISDLSNFITLFAAWFSNLQKIVFYTFRSFIFRSSKQIHFCSLDQIQHIFVEGSKGKRITSVWLAESVFGAIGAILNSICLSIFLIGRDHLLSSVNATIW